MSIVLTDDQKAFLDKHGITVDMLFDARFTKPSVYGPSMRELNKFIAVNTTPCVRGGHTLRTRGGNCVQCNTAQLSYALAHVKRTVLYVAFSCEIDAVKIGTVDTLPNLPKRITNLNHRAYGGVTDWVLVFAYKCPPLGAHKAETYLHRFFKNKQYVATYWNCHESLCQEIFKVCPSDVYCELARMHAGDFSYEKEYVYPDFYTYMLGNVAAA